MRRTTDPCIHFRDRKWGEATGSSIYTIEPGHGFDLSSALSLYWGSSLYNSIQWRSCFSPLFYRSSRSTYGIEPINSKCRQEEFAFLLLWSSDRALSDQDN